MKIGAYTLENRLILAPMAGVTDRPFRLLCREHGAAMAVSEMVTSDTRLWHTEKSRLRLNHQGESSPRSVQIVGTEPVAMAIAAQENIERGAEIIDINMGCPAKKVCHKAAGAALMRDEKLVAEILTSVVSAVDAPVTLKIRTGWDEAEKNALQIARIAEQSGIQAVTIHGRTRQQKYSGDAEYDTIAAVKQALTIPVIANGDITSAEKAQEIMAYTKADALMIGRAAQGRPWIFNQINIFLNTGRHAPEPSAEQKQAIILQHLDAIHLFYGEKRGVRIARKHLCCYFNGRPEYENFRRTINQAETARSQIKNVRRLFKHNIFGASMEQRGMAA